MVLSPLPRRRPDSKDRVSLPEKPLARGHPTPSLLGSWPILPGTGYSASPLSSFMPASHKQPLLLAKAPSRVATSDAPELLAPPHPQPLHAPQWTPCLPQAASPLPQSAR